MSAGYAFVDFGSGAIAKMAMKQFNGLSMPNSSKSFKLNWASGGGLIDKRFSFSFFVTCFAFPFVLIHIYQRGGRTFYIYR